MPTCHRHYPGRFDGACSLVLSIASGLPCVTVRSAFPAITFSGPAQRSLTLWPARSPNRLATLHRKLRQLRCLRRRFDCFYEKVVKIKADSDFPFAMRRMLIDRFSPRSFQKLWPMLPTAAVLL